ncbi:hypothetical protein YSA_08513 [Pseudomonas putida ND6]|uniref:Uncharacterized protein n=1 Tax=Pseudomonas putida ND6 TaxID=231023 RepID=I3V0U9_PSEPU|nr:hypothetical protein YSA_08513 [Pseudomonas putida ND6]
MQRACLDAFVGAEIERRRRGASRARSRLHLLQRGHDSVICVADLGAWQASRIMAGSPLNFWL